MAIISDFNRDPSPYDPVSFKEISVDLNETMYISKCVRETGKFQARRNDILEALVYTLQCKLHSNKLDDQLVMYPKDWWEAVKERFAPEWFKDRYPVKYTKKRFTVKDYYPDADIYHKFNQDFSVKMGSPIRVAALEDVSWRS